MRLWSLRRLPPTQTRLNQPAALTEAAAARMAAAAAAEQPEFRSDGVRTAAQAAVQRHTILIDVRALLSAPCLRGALVVGSQLPRCPRCAGTAGLGECGGDPRRRCRTPAGCWGCRQGGWALGLAGCKGPLSLSVVGGQANMATPPSRRRLAGAGGGAAQRGEAAAVCAARGGCRLWQ